MPALSVALIPGDGIGGEVTAEAVRVLEAAAALEEIALSTESFPHGADHYLRTGELADAALLDQLAQKDAILLGAVGDPRVTPRVLEGGLLVAIGRHFQMDISMRPYRLHAPHLTPLSARSAGDIDVVIVRESAEDLFALPAGSIHPGTEDEIQVGGIAFSRRMIERVIRYGLGLARERRRRLVVVEHSNAAASHELWRTTFERIAVENPDVEWERMAPDAFAMSLILEPERFDVAVTSWMLGGVFADIAAALVGGLGLSGSVRISSSGGPSMFEPAHGSAPKHAGKGTASPLGAIHSVELLLRHNGHAAAADRVARAISTALNDGSIPSVTTRSGVSTRAQGDAILSRL
jgi:3-isopropylmalate dehydrogenase